MLFYCLSTPQASTYFKRLDTCKPSHITPTFITEVLRLVAYVQLFKRNVKVKVTAYTEISYSY